MANISKTFPPKFSQNILYPAIYNLDEYDIPSGFDINYNDGVYFDVQFPGYNVNGTPTLTYGKHLFKVYVYQPTPDLTIEGYEKPGGLPKLKTKTRILFEFKDAAGTVLFSDVIPNFNPQGFGGYVWIKKDPLRTYDDIAEGYGSLTIVAKTDTDDNVWRNRYNVRFTHPVNLNLVDSNDSAYQNPSPIIFQNSTSSLRLKTEISEDLITLPDGDGLESNVQVSMSNLLTYSGKVQNVQTSIMVSGSSNQNYQLIGDYLLQSSSFENQIDVDYADGLNPISEKFNIPIPSDFLQQNGTTGNNVRFKFRFKNPNGDLAKDINNPALDFFIEYPSYNTWVNFQGNTLAFGTSVQQNIWDNNILHTSEGQYSFADIVYVAPSGSGGQKFNAVDGQGKLKSTGGSEGGGFTSPRGSGGSIN